MKFDVRKKGVFKLNGLGHFFVCLLMSYKQYDSWSFVGKRVNVMQIPLERNAFSDFGGMTVPT